MENLLDKDLYNKCIEEVKKLPQYESLNPQNIDTWLDAMYAMDPDRIFWHIKRLNGFGGSEIGHLVADDFDQFDMFGSPRETVADKLMLRIPEGPSGDTERGTFMEPTIQEMFRKKFKAEPLDAAMEKMQTFKSKDHPWLVGNTDDYVRLPNQKQYLVDYKCPRPGFAENYDKYGIKFDYIAQLHHYALILKELGEQVDGLLLCSFDMVKWDIDVRVVEIDQKMFDAILKNGDTMWFDYVMAANLPPWKEVEDKLDVMDATLPDEDRERVSLLAAELTALLPLANAAYKSAAEIKEEIGEILSRGVAGVPKISSGVIDINIKSSIDEEKIEAEARAANIELESHMTIQTPNLEKAWDHLSDLMIKDGKDMSPFMDRSINYLTLSEELIGIGIPDYKFKKESYTIGLTRSKSKVVMDTVEKIKTVSSVSVEEHMKSIGNVAPEAMVAASKEVSKAVSKKVKM